MEKLFNNPITILISLVCYFFVFGIVAMGVIFSGGPIWLLVIISALSLFFVAYSFIQLVSKIFSHQVGLKEKIASFIVLLVATYLVYFIVGFFLAK